MERGRQGWIWVGLLALLPLLGWWTYGLFDLDEGFYAAIASEMNRRGEWITPFYNGEPWFEKPILLYWVAKPMLWLFGDMAGPRMPSILSTLGLYALLGWFANRHLGEKAGKLSVLVAASSLLLAASGRMMLTDTLLVLALSGCFVCFWESLCPDPHPSLRDTFSPGEKSRTRWRVGAAVCLGLAILAKGPVAGAFFLLVAGITYWRQPDLRPAFRGGWFLSTLALAAVVASWYVPCYLANGQVFVQEFLIEQNVGRFQGGDKAHKVEGPAGYLFYLPILLLGMAPWIFRIVGAIKDSKASPDPFRTYLWTWAGVVFVFFTVSGSKLPHYVLPAVPALAILLADRWARISGPKIWAGAAAACFVIFLVAQGGFSAYYYGADLFGQKLPGFHAEVHRAAKYLAGQPGPVAVYQMPKRSKRAAAGRTKIQETSHPSILLYLGRTVDAPEKREELVTLQPSWVLTRTGRLSSEDLAWLKTNGLDLEEVETVPPSDLYRIFRVR